MWPELLMLAAQLYGKHQRQEEAKRREVVKLREEQARMLGGNTMGVEAADFNRQLGLQNYASPQELMNIYGAVKGGSGTEGAPEYDGNGALNQMIPQTQLQDPGGLNTPSTPGGTNYGGAPGGTNYGGAPGGINTGAGTPFTLDNRDNETNPYYARNFGLRDWTQ